MDQARHAAERDLDLSLGGVEEALGQVLGVLVHDGGRALGRLLGLEGLLAGLRGLREAPAVRVAALELGHAVLDGEHAAREEEDFVRRDVGSDPGGEARDRVAGEAEVVQRGVVGDREVGRHDDLDEHRVLGVAEALAQDLLDLAEDGPEALGEPGLVGEAGSGVGVDDEAGQYGQRELREFVGLAAAHSELLEIDALLDRLLLAEEVNVVLHGLSFCLVVRQNSAMTLFTGPRRKASNMWLAPCER